MGKAPPPLPSFNGLIIQPQAIKGNTHACTMTYKAKILTLDADCTSFLEGLGAARIPARLGGACRTCDVEGSSQSEDSPAAPVFARCSLETFLGLSLKGMALR